MFIEFVTILLLFYVLAFWPRGMWDLSSWARNRTISPALGGEVLTTGPPGKISSLGPHAANPFLERDWCLICRAAITKHCQRRGLNNRNLFLTVLAVLSSRSRSVWFLVRAFRCLFSVSSKGGSAGKESACNAGDPGSIPGLGRSFGEGNSYSLQYSGLENSMDCVVHGVAKSQTRLSNFHFHKAGREGKRDKHLSSGITSYKDTNPVRSGSQLYDLILLNRLLKALFPNAITLGVKASTYKFSLWGRDSSGLAYRFTL